MIDDYTNQSLTWKSRTGKNDYNEATYADAVTISGRKEPGFKLVRNEQGEEVVSSALVITKSAVSANDLIDGRLVVSSEPIPGLDGDVEFYEVYLK